LGKAARKRLPRSAQVLLIPFDLDPVAILETQHQTRGPDLIPILVGRMVEFPFAIYWGAGTVLAHDLGGHPTRAIRW